MNESELAHVDTLMYEQARREIDQCRFMLHVHWVALNHLGALTIDYDEWDDMACRLDSLHDTWPLLVHEGYEADYFMRWDASDWNDLPVTPYILTAANEMIDRMERIGFEVWDGQEVA